MEDKTAIAITAIISITILLGIALYKDIDGTLLSAGIAAISALAGYELKALRNKVEKKE